MKQPTTYQLDLFDNSVMIRATRRKSPVTIPQRDRDSEGRYVKCDITTAITELDKVKLELETERRKNIAISNFIRLQSEKIIELEKLINHE